MISVALGKEAPFAGPIDVMGNSRTTVVCGEQVRPALIFATNKTILLTCALVLAGAVHHAKGDTVTLTNGDVLTGTVVQSDNRGVILKHPILGTIPIANDRIAKITPDQLKTDEPAHSGRETESEKEKRASADPPEGRRTPTASQQQAKAAQAAARQAVEQERSVFQTILEAWNSRLTLGLNGTSGNTDRQNYRVMFNARKTNGRDRWDFNSRWVYAYANGNRNQNQFETNLTREWLQEDSPWFLFIKGQYKYDVKRSYQNRTSAFGGGGYTLAETDKLEVNTRMGFGGTYEYGSVNEFTPEAFFGGSVVSWEINERSSLEGETIFYPSLENREDYRVESSLQWLYKLDYANGLSFKLGLENEYNADASNDASNNDLKYYGAVVLKF